MRSSVVTSTSSTRSSRSPNPWSLIRTGAVAASALLAASTLAACGSSADASGGSLVGSGKTIAISLNGNNAYTSYVTEGVLKELKGTGYKFIGVQNNFDSSGELSNVQNLLSQGIKGLVIVPTDATTIAKAAQVSSAQGVAVANAVYPGASDADKYYAGVAAVDNVEGGKMMGEYVKAHAKPGKVIVVQGILGQGFSEDIDKGLDQSLAGSGFSVAVREQGFFDRDKAAKIVESALQAHPDVTAIVTESASMSDGVASYLKSIGREDILHVGDDGDDELFNTWLGTPYLAATRYYSAAETGVISAKAVRAKLEGTKPEFLGKVRQEMVTSDNAKQVLAEDPYSYPEFAAQAGKI